MNLAVESKASHRQGDTAAAGQALGDSKRILDARFSLLEGDLQDRYDWLIASILHREAEKTIGGLAENP